MRVQTLIIGGAIVAAVIILIRLIMGTPLITRIRENFANATATTKNTTTMCPSNSKLIMWDGKAYCCGGRVNVDTDRLEKVCTATTSDPSAPRPVFCTLGEETKEVRNCQHSRAADLAVEGARFCPSDAPTYVKGEGSAATAKCCASGSNDLGTDCRPVSTEDCEVVDDREMVFAPNSCNYRLLAQKHACPAGYKPVIGNTTIGNRTAYYVGCTGGERQYCELKPFMKALQKGGADMGRLKNLDDPSIQHYFCRE